MQLEACSLLRTGVLLKEMALLGIPKVTDCDGSLLQQSAVMLNLQILIELRPYDFRTFP